MSLKWIHENPPFWDEHKTAIVGGAKPGIFDLSHYHEREVLPGDWWRVEQDGKTVGYGWMDTIWGDAEILLAVDPAARAKGVGTFILEHLDLEAAGHGLNYLYNVVRPTHPDVAGITKWLKARGFAASGENDLLRRPVKKPGRAKP